METQPLPHLPSTFFSEQMREFVDLCLRKNPAERPDLRTLLLQPWLSGVEHDETDMADWIGGIIKLPLPQKSHVKVSL